MINDLSSLWCVDSGILDVKDCRKRLCRVKLAVHRHEISGVTLSISQPAAAYNKLFQYYEREQFLPTFGNFDTEAKLDAYALARRRVFDEKLMLPIQAFNGASVLQFGPDSGEDALVFAKWGANLTLAEPNARARSQIRSYFDRFALNDRLLALGADDIEGFPGDQTYDIIDAEGFIYTVQPSDLWLSKFGRHLNPGGFSIVTYYGKYGGFLELALKAIHSAYKTLTLSGPEDAAQALYRTKWDSIPHTRAFGSWLRDVLENPFVRLRYFIDAAEICRSADYHGFDLYSSWPVYRDTLDIYWHKKRLSTGDTLRRNLGHIKRSPLSFLSGQKMYLAGDATEVDALTELSEALLSHVDALIEAPLGERLAAFRLGLKALRLSVRSANILVDDPSAIDEFETLIEALEQIFLAVSRKDADGIARLTNSHPSFISAWGIPNHLLVLRKRLDATQG